MAEHVKGCTAAAAGQDQCDRGFRIGAGRMESMLDCTLVDAGLLRICAKLYNAHTRRQDTSRQMTRRQGLKAAAHTCMVVHAEPKALRLLRYDSDTAFSDSTTSDASEKPYCRHNRPMARQRQAKAARSGCNGQALLWQEPGEAQLLPAHIARTQYASAAKPRLQMPCRSFLQLMHRHQDSEPAAPTSTVTSCWR